MHKNTLWLVLALVCIYLALVYCDEQQEQQLPGNDLEDSTNDLLRSDVTDLQEEGRTRRRHRHHLWHRWGFAALAIAYLVKIKMVIVAFFVGSAVYLGLRYVWPNKCNQEIILDHPPPSFSHHDHIPYSLEHSDHHEHYSEHPHFDSSSWDSSSTGISSFEPYSAYSSAYAASDSPPESISSEKPTFRLKRAVNDGEDKSATEEARQMPMATEEQIGNFMFMFLGLDSKACRRRFICEMEFRSRLNPLTAMAFRVVGRSFFAKYTNDRNELGQAHSFEECAAVNAECIFIENESAAEEETNTDDAAASESVNDTKGEDENAAAADDVLKMDLPTEESNAIDSNNVEERANYQNILAERRNSYRRRVRGDRHFKPQ